MKGLVTAVGWSFCFMGHQKKRKEKKRKEKKRKEKKRKGS
jgi:Tfp pilus assembly protein PilO